MNVTPLDWAIVAIPVVLVTALAIYARTYVKGVSDFLAAGRSAGRYLICNAEGAASMGAITIVAIFEQISNGGPAIIFWELLSTPVTLVIALTGFVIYRYRETRAMTMAQFFEMRYSKRFRVFMGLMAFISGVLNYGIFPAVGARFVVHFCGFPESLTLGTVSIPTFAVIMLGVMSLNVAFATLGGMLTAMVTDCIEGIISGVFLLTVAFVMIAMLGLDSMREALMNRPPGESFLDPFDTFKLQDFNLWFVLIGIFFSIYNFMAWQGSQGFRASALNPHEARMGRILGQWRTYTRVSMVVVLGICGYTFLHHPDFTAQAATVQNTVAGITDGTMIQKQMTVPIALSYAMPIGIKGMFFAVMVFAMMAADTSYMHSWGSIFIQDVVLPFRKTRLSPEAHIRLLRFAITGVAVFAFFFSLLFRQTEYILMYFAITGAIFLGGAGSAIIGGLYWKRGTTAAAWSAMIVGSTLALGSIVVRQAHPDFPLNGQVLSFLSALIAITVYVAVSLLTCRQPHNLEKLFHRGRYAVDEEGNPLPEIEKPPRTLRSILGIEGHFSRGDKAQAVALFSWSMALFSLFVIICVWNLFNRWPLDWWWNYQLIMGIGFPLAVGLITSIWFGIGGVRDVFRLFQILKTKKRIAADDGEVPNANHG